MQTITAVEACTAARKAHNEGRLLAQCETIPAESISYGYEVDIGDTKFVCAIGASLNQGSLNAIKEAGRELSTIESGMGTFRGIFDVARGDVSVLIILQREHDHWLMARREGRAPDRIERAEERFLAVIQGALEPEGIA